MGVVKNQLYPVDEKTVVEKINELKPLNYNQFRWWRRFDTHNKPLHKYSSLIDKIRNGDYDFSHYYWQFKFSEVEINEIYDATYPDASEFNQKATLHRARRKRLIEDFEKDEKQKLDQLQKDFYHYFNMPRTAVMKEMSDFDGCLEDFYNYCQAQFGPRQEKINKRGRKPKKYLAP